MKSNSITFKLFVRTILIGILFLNIIMVLQTVLFDHFYLYRKTQSIEKDIENLQQAYSQKHPQKIDQYLSDKIYDIAILDETGQEMMRHSIIGQDYEKGKAWTLKNYKGTNETEQYEYQNTEKNKQYVMFMAPLTKDEANSEYIFIMTEKHLASNLKDTFQYFYVLIFFCIIVIIFILSYLYSLYITRPLIQMDHTAKKMASLDFNKKLEIHRDDEIGSLASSMNQLSSNLQKSMQQLELNNKKLKEFTANASHELKTPLAIMSGYVEGIKDGVYTKKHLDLVEKEIEKMNQLILDMLEVSKTDGEQSLKKAVFKIDDLVNSVAQRFESNMIKKQINLEMDMESIHVFADREKIQLVIENLFKNAITYTKEQKSIYIKTKHIENGKMRFAIENDAKPLSQEDMDKIWDRFYRVDASRDKKTGGTGLGLAITKNILTSHNSDFGVENTEIGIQIFFTLERVS